MCLPYLLVHPENFPMGKGSRAANRGYPENRAAQGRAGLPKAVQRGLRDRLGRNG